MPNHHRHRQRLRRSEAGQGGRYRYLRRRIRKLSRKLILPEIVEIAYSAVGIVAIAPKEPEMAAAVSQAHGALVASGDVSGGGRSQCAVHARLVDRAASAHPRPLVRGRIQYPKVVEMATIAVGTNSISPNEPEMATAVGPACCYISASGDISSGRRSQRAVHTGLATAKAGHRAASAHPRPLVRGWIELPKVVEIA